MNIPVIKMEIEGMRYTLLTHLSEYKTRMDDQLAQAVTAFCAEGNIERIIDEAVRRELDRAVDAAVKDFFSYSSEGRKIVAAAVREKLLESYTGTALD